MEKRFLTLDDAALQLGVSAKTVANLCRERKIGHVKIGERFRFEQEDVDNYIKEGRVEPTHGGQK